MSKRTILAVSAIVAALLGFTGLRMLTFFYTDWLWFKNLGYESVLITSAIARMGTFLTFWLLFVAIAGTNVWIARLFGLRTRELPLEVIVGDSVPQVPVKVKRQRILWISVVLGAGFFMGTIGTTVWTAVLRFFNSVEFGLSDPIFQNELSFYHFKLPLYTFIRGWLLFTVALAAGMIAVSYYQDRSLRREGSGWATTPYVRAHLSALGAAFALLHAWGYHLKEYDLLFSFRKDSFFGGGYTDIHVQLFAYRIMLILSVVLAVVLIYNLHFRGWRLPMVGAGGYLSAVVLISWLFPSLFEQFAVKPNELELETPYIKHTIEYTRKAYGLDKIEEVSFPAESNLTPHDIQNNMPTIRSIPLWDRRPLMATYSQLQEIRSYYRFAGVDVDRYQVDGSYQQVMLAGREFSRNSLRGETWLNQHLVFTHGYGICMSPANEIGGEGLPEFFVKDIPPTSPVGLHIGRPEIYFGETMRDYVIVKTRTEEFDYPSGDENVYTTYRGRGGVHINSFFRRLAFAIRFGDPYLLVTDNLTPDSRILFDRHIGRRFRDEGPKRFQKLAPFLQFDKDPYLVTADENLYWIQDAYTVSNMYPYAQPFGRPYIRETNYIRNSVKAVLDAYDGTVTFYVWDEEDPLIQCYARIFPDLFRPKSEMPASLRSHVRYPVDLFKIQSSLYNTYHMASPQVFYNREDVWEPATEIYGVSERPQVMDPYYVIVRLPDADREEFVLMLPATPAQKANMIAWLLARCDGPNYGRLMVYKLPKEKLIYGPMLIERRIDQDTEVSKEITLWSQRGSDVIRGNLLVIPIENSFIYVEPLYLRATQAGMPELKRVLVVHGEKLAMGETLDEALEKVFGTDTNRRRVEESNGGGVSDGLQELSQTALKHFEDAQEHLRKGDFGAYGTTIEELRKVLIKLSESPKADTRSPAP